MNHEKDKDSGMTGSSFEPTGIPRYEHDLFNMTNKEKARNILDDLMLDYVEKGGTIKKMDMPE